MRCAGQSVVIVKMGERQRVYDVTICINGPSSRVDDDHVESETITSVLVKIDAAKYANITSAKIIFFGDTLDAATMGCSGPPEEETYCTASNFMKMLLTHCPRLEILEIEGFNWYHKSRRYRQWEAEDTLFSALQESPAIDAGDVVPAVSHLIFRRCCLSDDDIKNMCMSMPNLLRVDMSICAGHSTEVITEVLELRVDLNYDNDDGWQPGDDESKNTDVHM